MEHSIRFPLPFNIHVGFVIFSVIMLILCYKKKKNAYELYMLIGVASTMLIYVSEAKPFFYILGLEEIILFIMTVVDMVKVSKKAQAEEKAVLKQNRKRLMKRSMKNPTMPTSQRIQPTARKKTRTTPQNDPYERIFRMKIVLLEEKTVTQGDISLDCFYSLGDVTGYPLTPQDKVAERVGDAEAVIINKTVFTRELMEKCPKLRYIGLCATGYNNVDIAAANDLGITVCNVPAYSTSAVAQQAFSYVLYFASRTADYNADVHNGGWVRSDTFSYFTIPTYELDGLTMGIIGYGSIGKAVAKIARAFGMKVIAATRTPQTDSETEFVSIDEVFSRADFISVHCPLTDKTKDLVNSERLALCKQNAIVINTARGPIVNEHDLAEALNSGVIAGAGVDVVSVEPMQADNPLLTAKNCVITPHVAWAPVQTRTRLLKIASDNLKKFIDGTPQNTVN